MKKLTTIFFLLLLAVVAPAQMLNNPAWMRTQGSSGSGGGGGGGSQTVTYDTSAKSTFTAASATASISITVGANANKVLYVFAGVGDGTLANRTVDSVSSSVNGAFTAVSSGLADDGNFMHLESWKLVNPTAGAHTITVTYVPSGTAEQVLAFAISLYNVDQTTPNGTPTVVNGSVASTAPTAAVTLAANEMAIGAIATDSGPVLSVTTGTERQVTQNVAGDTAYSLASNTGSGSVSITWATGSEAYALVVIPVKGAP